MMFKVMPFIAGVILVMFTYWLGGGEFERSKELASTFILSFVIGISFFVFGKIFEKKDK